MSYQTELLGFRIWFSNYLTTNVKTKAMHSGESFGIQYIFRKMYRLSRNKKSEISGTFSTLVERPKICRWSRYWESRKAENFRQTHCLSKKPRGRDKTKGTSRTGDFKRVR